MERARLAVVAARWDPSRGGEEALLSDLAGALARDGVAVTVLCREGSDARPGVAVELMRVPAWPRVRAERLFRREASRRALASGGPLLATRPVPSATHVQLHAGLLADAFAAER
ncbi:glycosyltransferase family 4 protein [Acidobacteria bacterium ACD]|nr:glycosyltransferase family 4 protein [Acidobacteria bacterium ACD]